jgi:predicted component of type VI protein secretion system
MITLRLFRQSNPFQQIGERALPGGELIIGRGDDADWPLEDPDRRLSRRHCVFGVLAGTPTLRDISANGVFIGAGRSRPKSDETVPLETGETVRLGDYLIVVEAAADSPAPEPPAATVRQALSATLPAEAPSGAAHGRAVADPTGLLESFCAGAHLDASVFADEDPEAVMRRLGAVYRQMVGGLTDLMSDRTTVKAEYRMDRTTVRAAGNNPFRWASEQRVAVDLLRAREDGFLSGPAAVKMSFADVKKHLLCVLAGSRASLSALAQALSPATVEAAAPSGFLLRANGTAAWKAYRTLHAERASEIETDVDGPVAHAFRAAYGQRLEDLDHQDEDD